MGILIQLPAILFIILAASMGGFAIAVHTIPTAHEFYESYIKERLEEAEYIFNWIGGIYFVLPILWCDAAYSVIVVIQLLAFVGDIEKSIGRIATEYAGVPIQLSCVFAYIMLKRSNDPKFDLYLQQSQAMILFSFYTNCLLVLYRYIGPRKLKAGFDSVAACILRGLTATKDCIAKTCVDIYAWLRRTGSDMKNSWQLLCTWVEAWIEIRRAKKALAAAQRRNAGLSLEEHFSALRV